MCYKRFGANNLTFLIMYFVIVQGGLKDEHVAQRLKLGANWVIIFQGFRIGKQFRHNGNMFHLS
jgi:hypothetical protein